MLTPFRYIDPPKTFFMLFSEYCFPDFMELNAVAETIADISSSDASVLRWLLIFLTFFKGSWNKITPIFSGLYSGEETSICKTILRCIIKPECFSRLHGL